MLVFILSSDVFHSSSSRPLSVANSVDGDHRQSPSGLTRKGNGYTRSRSWSPPKFPSSRSPAALNGHSKDQRNDKFFGKSDIHPENFPNAQSHNSGTSNHSLQTYCTSFILLLQQINIKNLLQPCKTYKTCVFFSCLFILL